MSEQVRAPFRRAMQLDGGAGAGLLPNIAIPFAVVGITGLGLVDIAAYNDRDWIKRAN